MTELSPESLLRARTLEELGEVARELGLTVALRAPMKRVLGLDPRTGRLTREVDKLVAALGTDDVAALLVDGPALLEARPMQGVKKKLFEHARTYLYEAARDDAGLDPAAPEPEPDGAELLEALEAAGLRRGGDRAPDADAGRTRTNPSPERLDGGSAGLEPSGGRTGPRGAGDASRTSGADARPGRVATGGAVQDYLRSGPGRSSGGRGGADAPAGDAPGRPATREALRAWAETHEVAAALPRRLFATLSDRNPRLFSGMVDPRVENAPIEDVLVDPALALGSGRQRRRLEELRAAAWAYLDEEAALAAEGVAEERARDLAGRSRPDDEVRGRLIDRLLTARARVRGAFAPRPAARVQSHHLEIEPGEAPEAVYVEQAESRLAFPVKVTVRLETSGELHVRSSHSGTDADPYVLSALDALLEALFDEADSSVEPLLDATRHPAWRRGLIALTEALRPAAADEELEGLLGWWVTVEPSLGLRPVVQKRKRGGGLAKPRPVALERLLGVAEALDPTDRAVAERLDLAEVATRRSTQDALRLRVRALARLAGHPRVFFGEGETQGRLRRARLGIHVSKALDELIVGPQLDGHLLPVGGLAAHRRGEGAGSLVFFRPDEQTLIFDVLSPAADRALDVLARYPRAWPEQAQDELVAQLPILERLGPVRFEASVPRTKVPAQPTLVLQLEGAEAGVRGRVRVRLLATAPLVEPGEGPDELVAARPDRSLVYTPRNLPSERAWAEGQLSSLFDDPGLVTETLTFALESPEAVFALLDRVRSADGVEVQWASGAWRVSRAFTEDLRVEVKDRRDWFGLDGAVEVDGHRVQLAVLLDVARGGRRYVALGDGDFVVLESALMERLAGLEPAAHVDRGEVRVSSAAAEAVEALGGIAAEYEVAEGWRAAVARMQAAAELEPEVPPDLQAELRPYQRAGFEWLARLSTWGLGACLADDMGLGKTLQTLSALLFRAAEGPALVIAPTSVTFNWLREAARFTPTLEVRRYGGPSRAAALQDLGPGTLVVTSYGLATRDAAALGEIDWATLVLDEAQAIKNAQSQRSQALATLPARWRLALSGTPIENRLSELWSLFRVIEPGLLGSWAQFKDRFASPIERDRDEARAAALSRLIRPFVLRRTKAEVAPELPPRTDVEVDVVLSEAQRALYEDVRLATLARLEEGDEDGPEDAPGGGRFQVLAALTRLRQLACHPRLDAADSEVAGAKLERLMELVGDLIEEGQSALIFSQFTAHLALVRAALEAADLDYLYLDGQTPVAQRAEQVDAFQAGAAPLFLISLKAGGTGLNLTAADNVILLDPWWNPAVEDQATDRAHRIGRDRPVTVYRLVSRDTVEDAILALHRQKRALVGQVLDGTGAAASLGVDELVGLIRDGGGADDADGDL